MSMHLYAPSPPSRRTRLASPPVMAPLPLKMAMEDRDDQVEELASTPKYGYELGSNPITLATEFGHMTGRRLSVASMASDTYGDDLPGAKARRVLGIKTSSGFDDGDLDDRAATAARHKERSGVFHAAVPLPRRTASPSFLSAMSSVVRRGSTKTPSLTSSATTDEDEWDSGSSSTRSSAELGPPMLSHHKRRPSFSNLFGLGVPREDARPSPQQLHSPNRPRSNSVDAMQHSSVPHYRKAKTVDTRAAVDAGWMRKADAAASQLRTPERRPPSRAQPLSLDLQPSFGTSAALAPSPSPALDQEIIISPSPTRNTDASELHSSNADAADLEHLYKALPSVPSALLWPRQNGMEQHRHQRRRESEWSQDSSYPGSELPSLIGDGSQRSASPSESLWSCRTGSSMSLDMAMTRSDLSRRAADSSTEHEHGRPDLPSRQSSLDDAKVSRHGAQGCGVRAHMPVIPWHNPAPLHHAAISHPQATTQSNVDDSRTSAFVKPRRAPKPPSEQQLLPLQVPKRVFVGQRDVRNTLDAAQETPRCIPDEVYLVTRDDSSIDDWSNPSSSNTLASLIPSYYLRSPSEVESDDAIINQVLTPQPQDVPGKTDDDEVIEEDETDQQLRAVLHADSPDKLRAALAAAAIAETSLSDAPIAAAEAHPAERPALAPGAGDTAILPSQTPPVQLIERRTMSSDAAERGVGHGRESMVVPVDEDAEQQELIRFSASADKLLALKSDGTTSSSLSTKPHVSVQVADTAAASGWTDYECPDARRSIEDALDSIILDLPSRFPTPSDEPAKASSRPHSPLKINPVKKLDSVAARSVASPSFTVPPRSPLRAKPRYALPIV